MKEVSYPIRCLSIYAVYCSRGVYLAFDTPILIIVEWSFVSNDCVQNCCRHPWDSIACVKLTTRTYETDMLSGKDAVPGCSYLRKGNWSFAQSLCPLFEWKSI